MYNIQQIIESWKQDTKIDDLNLDLENTKIPSLHSKYIGMLSEERMSLRAYKTKLKTLAVKLRDYFSGAMSEDDLKAFGREQFRLKIMRSDLDERIKSDDEYLRLEARISMQEEKVDVLLEIMKSINFRNMTLRNAIEYRKMMLGGG